MSNIKINDVFQRIQYAATNGQTQFAIPFPFFDNAYVTVWLDGVALVQGGGAGEYGISGAGSPSGGLVTLVTPAAVDEIITIEGIMPIDRTSIYSATISNLTGSDLNGDFNREVVMMKQIQTTQAQLQLQYAPWSVIAQDVTDTTDRYIPLLLPLEAWRMNAGGTAIETFLTPAGGGLAPNDATYILQIANAELPNAQDIASLTSGILIGTTTTGEIISRVLAGVTNQTVITNASGIGGNPTVGIASNPIIPGTAGVGIPAGTTAQRVTPTPPSIGLRFNTDLLLVEYYDAALVAWVSISNDTTLLALLASHSVSEGASLIGLQDQSGVSSKTVQDLANAGIIAKTDNGTLTNGQFLADLATGFTYVTTATGLLGSRIHTGTANQIDIANGSGAGGDPTYSLSATLNLPGTFNIQSTTAINAIINDPTLAAGTTTNISTTAALKSYIDSLVTGLNIQGACVCATTTALTATYANGASGVGATLTNAGVPAVISLDGVSPTVGQRVLIKNQASTFENGIYTVTDVGSIITNWILTRATDYDVASDVQPGDLVILTGGSTQAESSWVQTNTVVTMGTDPIVFVQFTASLPVNVSSGGTGVTSFTAYAPIVGGTTTTGSLQSITLGAAGTLFQSAGVGVLPGFTTAKYPATAGTAGTMLRSNATDFVNSTSTFADTYAINTLLYAGTANTISGLATSNSAGLLTNGSGVPGWVAYTGSGAPVLGTNPTIATPHIDFIQGATSHIVEFRDGASAVNYLVFLNSATGAGVQIAPAGTDSDISTVISSKGLGQIVLASTHLTIPLLIFNGTLSGSLPQHRTDFAFANTAQNRVVTFPDATGTLLMTGQAISTVPSIAFSSTSGVIGSVTNDSAAAGSVGEFVSSVVAAASAISITANTATNLTSISLTAGDWDVWGNLEFLTPASTSVTGFIAWVSSTSATLPNASLWNSSATAAFVPGAGGHIGKVAPSLRFSLSGTTTVYISGQSAFTASTMTFCGGIYARRVR